MGLVNVTVSCAVHLGIDKGKDRRRECSRAGFPLWKVGGRESQSASQHRFNTKQISFHNHVTDNHLHSIMLYLPLLLRDIVPQS